MINKINKKSLALSQILILVLGIIAIGYAFQSEIKEVKASTFPPETSVVNPPTLEIPTPAPDSEGDIDAEITKSLGAIVKTTPEKVQSGFVKFLGNRGSALLNIAADAGIAFGIHFVLNQIGPWITSDKEAIKTGADAVAIGTFTARAIPHVIGFFSKSAGGKVATFLGGKVVSLGPLGALSGTTLIGIGVAVAYFVFTYKKISEQKVSFQCLPWQAKLGGADCDKCNKGKFPCTEYQCEALGQGCNLTNVGTKEELCVWNNRKDTSPPVIQPWQDALLSDKYSYKPDAKTSPPDRGVFIKYNGGCIPAFTPFRFGITLNEPATCKADTERKKTFDEMSLYFGENSLARYNHTQTIILPSNESLAAENLTLKNDGNFEIYVRCVDVNGNPVPSSPSSSFVFKYCVDKGPDTQAPIIMGTNLINDMPIAYNQSSIEDLTVYVNEPSECRWTHEKDVVFDQMENNMSCSSSVFEMNAQMLYQCTTTLTSLKNRQDNVFYFRCKDKPYATKDRNVMTRGYKFTVKGTQPLVIDEIGPNGTIKDSVDPAKVTLKVRTSAGYKEGDATCYYSESCYVQAGSRYKYTMFYYAQGTSSYQHQQDLWISQGKYQCSIQCVDLGGNVDTKDLEYSVEIDDKSPEVVRVYKENDNLAVITDEDASCAYDFTSCNYLFDDGLKMDTVHGTEHYTPWEADKTYYVRCKDQYGKQPYSNTCSIIVRPFEVFDRGK